MEGKNHILCSSAIVLSAAMNHISLDRIRDGSVNIFYGYNASCINGFIEIDTRIWNIIGIKPELNINIIPVFSLFMLIMIIGTLMTDCDKANSIAGRFLYIPVQHRTWLHAIWIPAIIFSVGIFIKTNIYIHATSILIWYALGWFLHEFMDSFSKMGNSYLYPFIKYNSYGNAKVKQGIHFFKWYYTGKPSEGVFVIFTILNCVLFSIFLYLSPNYTIDLSNIIDYLI